MSSVRSLHRPGRVPLRSGHSSVALRVVTSGGGEHERRAARRRPISPARTHSTVSPEAIQAMTDGQRRAKGTTRKGRGRGRGDDERR